MGTSALQFLRDLPTTSTWVLAVIFLLVVLQEAVNGFHDTSNAVATVIYSNAMRAKHAVYMSAAMNFLGVLLGGTAVAFGMVFLLPIEMVAGINTIHEASLMLALVLTAVAWNLATWWYGIPNSTTHTYVGSIIGVSMAHAVIAGTPVADAINWVQGEKVLVTLFLSPVLGGLLAWALFKMVRLVFRRPSLFEPHQKGTTPPPSVRYPLIAAAAGVSLLHGTNDGQKSIGLMMMVLMGLAPSVYAIDPVQGGMSADRFMRVTQELKEVAAPLVGRPDAPRAGDLLREIEDIEAFARRDYAAKPLDEEERIRFRAEILDVHEALGKILHDARSMQKLPQESVVKLRDAYAATTQLIEGVPFWLIVLSALALGVGTMVGYEKIVKTLGEKMGDKHMSPAQGLSAQAAAVVSIGMADFGGVPVSTTHVLTAGVAGSVLSSGDRVQWETLVRIVITWFTTLPGTVVASFGMGIVLHAAMV